MLTSRTVTTTVISYAGRTGTRASWSAATVRIMATPQTATATATRAGTSTATFHPATPTVRAISGRMVGATITERDQ